VKTRARRSFIVCSIVLYLTWAVFLLCMTPEHEPRPLPAMPPGRLPLSKTGGLPATDTAGPDGASLITDPAILARLEQWLADRGRDADGLIALYDLTGNIALLHEAAGNWPYDPHVALAMIRTLRHDPAAALPWIEQALVLEGFNPELYFLKHWALSATGDAAGALEALRHITRLEVDRDTHLSQRIDNVAQAARAASMSEAGITDLSLDVLRHRAGFELASEGLYETCLSEIESVKEAQDQQRRREVTEFIVGLMASLRTAGGLSMGEERLSIGIVLRALELLPDDVKVERSDKTVDELRRALLPDYSYILKLRFDDDTTAILLHHATAEDKQKYVDTFIQQDQLLAVQILRGDITWPPSFETDTPNLQDTQATPEGK